jgi:hypothetical protein
MPWNTSILNSAGEKCGLDVPGQINALCIMSPGKSVETMKKSGKSGWTSRLASILAINYDFLATLASDTCHKASIMVCS